MQRLRIYHEPSSCGNTYDHYGGRTYFKHCHHGNGDIPLHVNCTITKHVPHTPLPWEHPALHSVAMGKKAPTAIYLLLLWKHPDFCASCCYGNDHFLHLVTMVHYILLCCSHTVAVDAPTFPTWSCMPPRPIILSVWRAHSSPSFACWLLGWWAWLWISRFKMAAGRQEAGMNEATGVRRHYLLMRASVLLVVHTVEPLYRGHHWDPAGCSVYSGTSL